MMEWVQRVVNPTELRSLFRALPHEIQDHKARIELRCMQYPYANVCKASASARRSSKTVSHRKMSPEPPIQSQEEGEEEEEKKKKKKNGSDGNNVDGKKLRDGKRYGKLLAMWDPRAFSRMLRLIWGWQACHN